MGLELQTTWQPSSSGREESRGGQLHGCSVTNEWEQDNSKGLETEQTVKCTRRACCPDLHPGGYSHTFEVCTGVVRKAEHRQKAEHQHVLMTFVKWTGSAYPIKQYPTYQFVWMQRQPSLKTLWGCSEIKIVFPTLYVQRKNPLACIVTKRNNIQRPEEVY